MKQIALKKFSLLFNKKTLVAYTIIAIFLGSFSGAALYGFSRLFDYNSDSMRFDSNRVLDKFISKEELINFLKTQPEKNNYYWGFPAIRGLKNIASLEMDSASGGSQGVPDYSGTNIQVEGVDEADVVKTDGTYLYLLNGEKIFIIKAYPPTEAGIISVLDLEYPATDIFIKDEKLVVIHSPDQYYIWYRWDYGPTLDYKMNTTIKVYDVSDKKYQIEHEVFFFDMPDLMGDNGINLFGLEVAKERVGDQDIAELPYQPHHTGGDHSTAEDGPVKDVGIFHSCPLAQIFDPSPVITWFQWLAAPEFLNDQGTGDGDGKEKNKEVYDLAFCC